MDKLTMADWLRCFLKCMETGQIDQANWALSHLTSNYSHN